MKFKRIIENEDGRIILEKHEGQLILSVIEIYRKNQLGDIETTTAQYVLRDHDLVKLRNMFLAVIYEQPDSEDESNNLTGDDRMPNGLKSIAKRMRVRTPNLTVTDSKPLAEDKKNRRRGDRARAVARSRKAKQTKTPPSEGGTT
jgi:hypothetical protein